jgi:hypothetical protein
MSSKNTPKTEVAGLHLASTPKQAMSDFWRQKLRPNSRAVVCPQRQVQVDICGSSAEEQRRKEIKLEGVGLNGEWWTFWRFQHFTSILFDTLKWSPIYTKPKSFKHSKDHSVSTQF